MSRHLEEFLIVDCEKSFYRCHVMATSDGLVWFVPYVYPGLVDTTPDAHIGRERFILETSSQPA